MFSVTKRVLWLQQLIFSRSACLLTLKQHLSASWKITVTNIQLFGQARRFESPEMQVEKKT